MFNISTETTGTSITISIEGVLDSSTSPKLETVIENNLKDVKEVCFDLTKLEYMTSAGLRAILVAQQEMDRIDGYMVVKNVPDEVMVVFSATGFANLLNIE